LEKVRCIRIGRLLGFLPNVQGQKSVRAKFLELIKRGDVSKIQGRIRDIFPAHNGHLSENPRRQTIYEFAACITLVTRFAIEGGLATEAAYTLSDAYIKSADKTADAKEVYAVYERMLIDFATKVKRAKKRFSLPVMRCMEYIDSSLHSQISLEDIGKAAGRNPAYICVQFKTETGMALTKSISINSNLAQEKV
jgi:YesN/AraC family two-component response regulator